METSIKQQNEMAVSRVISREIENAIRYLREKSDTILWSRLYQKILFLVEFEYYKKHGHYLLGLHFRSYKFGPFNRDIADALDNPNPCSTNNKVVLDEIDSILQQYNLLAFDRENMERAYTNMIDYIHSLLIYNLTPFNEPILFENYNFDDLFITIPSKLNGLQLEKEKYESSVIYNQSRKNTCL